jgi:hypothetical protein
VLSHGATVGDFGKEIQRRSLHHVPRQSTKPQKSGIVDPASQALTREDAKKTPSLPYPSQWRSYVLASPKPAKQARDK